MDIRKVTEEDGKVKYEVIVKVRTKAGKQVMKRRRWFTTEREAKKVEIELSMMLQGHKSKVTWNSWSEHVLESYRMQYRNSTYQSYQSALKKWFTPLWKLKYLDEIKPSDVHEAIFEHAKDVSSYTKRGLLKIVKRIFHLAIEEGVLIRSPAAGIKVRCAEAKQSVLNSDEIEILLREARRVDHRFFPHWMFALLTGMRSGEMYCLRWTDVDLIGGKISITKAWTKKNGEGETKTAKSRVLPISVECRRFLTELRNKKNADTEYVLPRLWEWNEGEQARILRTFCQEIGITKVKFHDLRATFITMMLNNGAPLSKVMAIVGHSALKTTQGYLRMSGKDIEGATEILGVKVPAELAPANVIELSNWA
jgi:integrase